MSVNKKDILKQARIKATVAVHEYAMILEDVSASKLSEDKVLEIIFNHGHNGQTVLRIAREVERC